MRSPISYGNLIKRQSLYILLGLLLVFLIAFSGNSKVLAASNCVPFANSFSTTGIGAGQAPWNLGKPSTQWATCPTRYEYVPHVSCCPISEIGLRPYQLLIETSQLSAVVLVTIAIQVIGLICVSALFKG